MAMSVSGCCAGGKAAAAALWDGDGFRYFLQVLLSSSVNPAHSKPAVSHFRFTTLHS